MHPAISSDCRPCMYPSSRAFSCRAPATCMRYERRRHAGMLQRQPMRSDRATLKQINTATLTQTTVTSLVLVPISGWVQAAPEPHEKSCLTALARRSQGKAVNSTTAPSVFFARYVYSQYSMISLLFCRAVHIVAVLRPEWVYIWRTAALQLRALATSKNDGPPASPHP